MYQWKLVTFEYVLDEHMRTIRATREVRYAGERVVDVSGGGAEPEGV